MTFNVDVVKKSVIFFATPCYGGMVTDQYFVSMFKLTQLLFKHQINFGIHTMRNESLITRARNILTAVFLSDPTYTHIMFIDADIEFEAESIIRMVALDRDIIAGAYPKKAINWGAIRGGVERDVADLASCGAAYAINLKTGNRFNPAAALPDGTVEVLDASTGFMLIKRAVIERLVAANPHLNYVNDDATYAQYNPYCYALFDTMIDPSDKRYLSEDFTFCRRWQELGGSIWIDMHAKLNHVGSYTFQGNLRNLFASSPMD